MKLYEYQAKALLAEFKIPIPPGRVFSSLDSIDSAESVLVNSESLNFPVIVKAQIQAGGRGKVGGIIKVNSPKELADASKKLLGSKLTTPQTPADGEVVNNVYIEQYCKVEREIYLSLTLDQDKGKVCIIASSNGGINIEDVARDNPNLVTRVFIDPYFVGLQGTGLQDFQLDFIIEKLNIPQQLHSPFRDCLINLYRAYWELDADIIEINPLVITVDASLYALDAKITIDHNALYRQAKIRDFATAIPLNPDQQKADNYGLSYIKLGGTIGCMVNGAGLAMATLDLLKFYGGDPANFLDIGGSANEERVTAAFELILSDANVKVIFVNIFGGIVRGEVLANGILAALNNVGNAATKLPIVARIQGTNHREALELLRNSPLKIMVYDNLIDAAQQTVKLAKQ